jgi:hypothetical protein
MQYLWGEFQNNPTSVMQNNHGDQDWITKRAKTIFVIGPTNGSAVTNGK